MPRTPPPAALSRNAWACREQGSLAAALCNVADALVARSKWQHAGVDGDASCRRFTAATDFVLNSCRAPSIRRVVRASWPRCSAAFHQQRSQRNAAVEMLP
ncbi:MAG: hypothetical protein ACPIOQ_59475 [Promethearchaeia archaeon]